MKIKVFANTNKLHVLSRCSCHVLYQEIELVGIRIMLCWWFCFIQILSFFHTSHRFNNISCKYRHYFFSNYTKKFLVFNTFPTLHVSCFFFLNIMSYFFFINEHLIFLFMLYYLQFILEVIVCKIAILWVHVSP